MNWLQPNFLVESQRLDKEQSSRKDISETWREGVECEEPIDLQQGMNLLAAFKYSQEVIWFFDEGYPRYLKEVWHSWSPIS